MTRFQIDKWLEDPERTVVYKDGTPVKIMQIPTFCDTQGEVSGAYMMARHGRPFELITEDEYEDYFIVPEERQITELEASMLGYLQEASRCVNEHDRVETTRQYAITFLSIVSSEILYAIQDLASADIYKDDSVVPAPNEILEWEQNKKEVTEFLTNIKENKQADCNPEKINKWLQWIGIL